MIKHPKTSKHLDVVIDNNYDMHTTGQQLTGKVRIDATKSEGLEVSQISVNLVCEAKVRIKRIDQVDRRNGRNAKNAMRLFDKEMRLLNQPITLGNGEQEVPFQFVLPELPPTSSYQGKRGTGGSVKHLILVSVFGKKHINSKPIMQGVCYFTFVPSSVIPSTETPEELTFSVDNSAMRGGKFVQSLDATANGIDTLQRYAKIPIVGLGVSSVGSLIRAAADAGRASNSRKSSAVLYGNLRLPSQALRQDVPTDFVLELGTVDGAEPVLIKSVSVNLQVVQVLKVFQRKHEAVIDTVPLFHQAVVNKGEDLSITGALKIDMSVLPTFNTPLYSLVHKLEFNIELSPLTGKKAGTPVQIVELVPAKLLSFIIQSSSQDPPRYTPGDYSRFMAYSNTGTTSKFQENGDSDEEDEINSCVEPYVPDINARSDSDDDVSGPRDEKSSFIPSGYPIDAKEPPLPSYDELN